MKGTIYNIKIPEHRQKQFEEFTEEFNLYYEYVGDVENEK